MKPLLPPELLDAATSPLPDLDCLSRLYGIYSRLVHRSFAGDRESLLANSSPADCFRNHLKLTGEEVMEYERAWHGFDGAAITTLLEDEPCHWANQAVVGVTNSLPSASSPLPVAVGEGVLTDAQASLCEARRTLARIDSYSAAVTELLIKQYVVVSSPNLKSATHMPTYGAIYIDWRLALDHDKALLAIVHETTHHVLGLQTLFVSLISNPEALSKHALRPDQRPLRGTLHAFVVLLRMLQVASICVQESNESTHWTDRANCLRNDLSATYDYLASTAVWTAQGSCYWARLEREVVETLSLPELSVGG